MKDEELKYLKTLYKDLTDKYHKTNNEDYLEIAMTVNTVLIKYMKYKGIIK